MLAFFWAFLGSLCFLLFNFLTGGNRENRGCHESADRAGGSEEKNWRPIHHVRLLLGLSRFSLFPSVQFFNRRQLGKQRMPRVCRQGRWLRGEKLATHS